jgi:hypothetical protein
MVFLENDFDVQDNRRTQGNFAQWMPPFYLKKKDKAVIMVSEGFPKVLCYNGGSNADPTKIEVVNARNLPRNTIYTWYKNGQRLFGPGTDGSTLNIYEPGNYSVQLCSPQEEGCCPIPFSNEIVIRRNDTPPTFTFYQDNYFEGCEPEKIIRFSIDDVTCPNGNGGVGCFAKFVYSYGEETEVHNVPNDFLDLRIFNVVGRVTAIITDPLGCQVSKTIDIKPRAGCCPAIPATNANFENTIISAIREQGNITPNSMNRNDLRFYGTLTIDRDIIFRDMNLTFNTGAEILMSGNYTLTFDNCTIDCCGDRMWKGINASAGKVKLINNTTLACAEIGMNLSLTAEATINTSKMDRNNKHIVINRVDKPLNLNGATFDCTRLLLSPFTDQKTAIAIEGLGGGQAPTDIPLQLTVGSVNGSRNTFRNCSTAIAASNYNLSMVNNTIDSGIEGGFGVEFIPYQLRPVNFTAQSVSPYENIFQNTAYGILITNGDQTKCTLNVQNCRFTDLRDWAFYINTGNFTLYPAVKGTIKDNTILNCGNGIGLSFINPVEKNFEILNNQISHCGTYGIFGIGFLFTDKSILIKDNPISDIGGIAIRLSNFSTSDEGFPPPTRIKIQTNTLRNVGINPNFEMQDGNVSFNSLRGGIYVSADNVTGKGKLDFDINGNSIENFQDRNPMFYGIFVDGGGNSKVNFNILPYNENGIFIKNSIFNAYRGIFGVNLYSSVIENNELYEIQFLTATNDAEALELQRFSAWYKKPCGIGLFGQVSNSVLAVKIKDNLIYSITDRLSLRASAYFGGISVWQSRNNQICNNDINDFQRSTMFLDGGSFPSDLKLNKFRNYTVGVSLVGDPGRQGIGLQYDVIDRNGPTGQPRVVVWNNEFHPQGQQTAGIYTEGYQGKRSPWAVRNTNPPYHPGFDQGGNVLSTDRDGNLNCRAPFVQENEKYCSVPVSTAPQIIALREQVDCGHVREINPPNGGPLARNRWKYTATHIEGLIEAAREPINPFTNNAGLYMIKQDLYDVLNGRPDFRVTFPPLDSFFLSQQGTNLAQLFEVESLIDSAKLISITRKVPCLPPNSTDTVHTPCPVKIAQRTAILNQALTVNNAIVSNNVMETNQKTVNDIRINQLLQFTKELTPSQEAVVVDIGQQCVRNGGRAVLHAIRMYYTRDHYGIPFTDTCDLPSYLPLQNVFTRQAELSDPVIAKPTLTLYPNPASHECTMTYQAPSDLTATIKAYNAGGAEMGSWTLKENGATLTLDTSKWSEGMYMINFIASDGTIQNHKLVIIK